MTAFAITMSIALVLIGVCWAIAWRDAVRMQCDRDKAVETTKLEAVRRVDIEELGRKQMEAEAALRLKMKEEDAKTWEGVMGLRERVTDLEKAVIGHVPAERRSQMRRGV